ncbi:Ctr copper transporter [Sistotremastrum suecicum HHB10207 ss-3]|uniref:Copper transport protein n=1 Tax=Sistotremastrum suecicum HHB10207 ss-3 TaxID=1314776 RepID=A0A166DZV0_9AGAM|nr:Ctr copper transporter [Sistotremastrum suecicum HHB10207 ss-3]
MDHGSIPHGTKCSMNMLWNTQIIDTCIIFREWHISSNGLFALSFFGILGLAIVYEGLRLLQTSIEVSTAQKEVATEGTSLGRLPDIGESNPLIQGRPRRHSPSLFFRLLRSVLYGISVFLAFFLMLVFMTYNAYLILAVVLGATTGHFIFSPYMNVAGDISERQLARGIACH